MVEIFIQECVLDLVNTELSELGTTFVSSAVENEDIDKDSITSVMFEMILDSVVETAPTTWAILSGVATNKAQLKIQHKNHQLVRNDSIANC